MTQAVDSASAEPLMRRVLDLARQAVTTGAGPPFGAVIVSAADAGRIVAEAHNEVLATSDPTAHAELLAVRRACIATDSIDLSGFVMYTNVAPCCMCMASALWSKVDRIHYLVGMEASTAIGLGDTHLYEELGRSLEDRVLTPVTALSMLQTEALETLSMWSAPGPVPAQ